MKITDVHCVQLVRRLERVQRNACSARQERRFTFVVVETTWRDEGSEEPVLVEKFNLIGRTKKS